METTFTMGVMLAFARVASFLFVIPFLKGRHIPAIAKMAVALGIAMSAGKKLEGIPFHHSLDFVWMVVVQVAIGLTLGFLVDMMMTAARNAGAIMDMDMGFSSSQVIDPANGSRNTVLSNLFMVFFMLVFVALGGINQMIYGVVYSFQFTPTIMFTVDVTFIEMLLAVFTYMMTATIQIALPLMASMFVVNLTLLILGKSAPQMNIFLNMFAIKIAAGILFFSFSIPILAELFMQMNGVMTEKFMEAMEVLLREKE